jgi:hypothetical protein
VHYSTELDVRIGFPRALPRFDKLRTWLV